MAAQGEGNQKPKAVRPHGEGEIGSLSRVECGDDVIERSDIAGAAETMTEAG